MDIVVKSMLLRWKIMARLSLLKMKTTLNHYCIALEPLNEDSITSLLENS